MKECTKLGHLVKQIFTELGEVYGSHNVSYEQVRRRRKKFHTATESVKDATKSGRQVTSTGRSSFS